MTLRGGLGAMRWQFAHSPVGIALLMRDGASLLRVGGPVAPLDLVSAVRRDWPDGTHEFACPRRDYRRARRAMTGEVRYWRRGPVRPTVSLVRLTLAEFRSHPAGGICRLTTCPSDTGLAVRGVAA